jgi:phage shock protein PspC (stress-responsive transcriptional regulator)
VPVGRIVDVATSELLRRSDSRAVVAGVCAGIAERYQIDPLLVRIAAVLIALSSGVGLVLYAAAWLLLPRGSSTPALMRVFPPVSRVRSRTWTLLVSAAAFLVLVLVGFVVNASLLPTMVVLGILYAAQLRLGTNPGTSPAASHPRLKEAGGPASTAWPLLSSAPAELVVTTPAGPWRPTNRWGQPLTAEECAAFYAVPDPIGLYEKRSPAAPVRRSRLVAAVSGLAIAATLAMMSLLGAFVLVPPATYLAVALVGVGGALIVGAFVGRPPGFLVIALGLVLVAGAMGGPMTGARAETDEGFSKASDMPAEVSVDGSYSLDLSHAVVDENKTVAVRVDAGNARVALPAHGNVVVVWRDAYGRVSLPDGQSGSSGQYERLVDPALPTLTLSVTVNLGNLDVTQ